MKYTEMVPNYDKEPEVPVTGYDDSAWMEYDNIIKEIKTKINKNKFVITVDCYPGVKDAEVLTAFVNGLQPARVIKSEAVFYERDQLNGLVRRNLTEDRVFGIMYYGAITDFVDKEKLGAAQEELEAVKSGVILLYGVGASLINHGDLLVYADLARWEIQQRFRRKELGNFKAENNDEDTLTKYKRSYFIEWRVADRHKKQIFDSLDYLLDTNCFNHPKMVSGDAFRAGLIETVRRPFRVVPYFDPGVWGGQWMKKVCGLNPAEPNFAWCFDCVPEENSLYLKYGSIRIEIPALDVVLYKPRELLGEKVYARFGAEFPIRFDFLDTMDGGNLSLQVHPLTEYIQEKFGMPYTQDESYYILDAKENSCVYLGIKDGIDQKKMFAELESAQKGEIQFEAEEYVNKFAARKHDHFLIPAGTIHCSGNNCMVLEISATPYIFTFKLWDWGRVGLDGLPRPIHLEHGKNVIQWERTTDWVKNNLVNQIKKISSNDSCIEEQTGLHVLEFIETRRYWFDMMIGLNTGGIVNVLNLVEGAEALVESTQSKFEPFVLHYAETMIVPAAVGEYTIKPFGISKDRTIAIIKAYVRF